MTVLGAISTGFNAVSSAIPLVGRLPSSREVFRFAIQAFVSSVNHSSNLAQWTFHPRIANKFTSLAEFISNYATGLIHRDSSENTEIVKKEHVSSSLLNIEPTDLEQLIEEADLLVRQVLDDANSSAFVDPCHEESLAASIKIDQRIIKDNERVEAAYAKAFAKADILAPVIRGAVARVKDLVDEVRELAEAFDQADAAKFDI
jgi:hypothetical protein